MRRISILACVVCASVLAYASGRPATIAVSLASATNTVARANATPPSNDGRCEATTKSGNRCKRKAVRDERFCRQHLKIQKKKEEKAKNFGAFRDPTGYRLTANC